MTYGNMVLGKFPPIKLPPGKFPPRKFPPGIFPLMTLNIPTHVFCFLFFHNCRRYHWYCLKDYFVILFLKVLKSDLLQCFKNFCSLPALVIIIHVFVLNDFIFGAFHEEFDVTKFNGCFWTNMTWPTRTIIPFLKL